MTFEDQVVKNILTRLSAFSTDTDGDLMPNGFVVMVDALNHKHAVLFSSLADRVETSVRELLEKGFMPAAIGWVPMEAPDEVIEAEQSRTWLSPVGEKYGRDVIHSFVWQANHEAADGLIDGFLEGGTVNYLIHKEGL